VADDLFFQGRGNAEGNIESLTNRPANQVEAVLRRNLLTSNVLDEWNVVNRIENGNPIG
jgi:hypothetical protein